MRVYKKRLRYYFCICKAQEVTLCNIWIAHISTEETYKLCLCNIMATIQRLRTLGLLYTQRSQSCTSISLSLTDRKKNYETVKRYISLQQSKYQKTYQVNRHKRCQFPYCKFLVITLQATRESKISGLKYHCNNFEKKVNISNEDKTRIQWQINNTNIAYHHIVTRNPDIVVYTDAGLTGQKVLMTL